MARLRNKGWAPLLFITLASVRGAVVSNVQLPIDSHGNLLRTGEARTLSPAPAPAPARAADSSGVHLQMHIFERSRCGAGVRAELQWLLLLLRQ